jgi:hypothetical protein
MCRWGAVEVGESLVETRAGNVRREQVAERCVGGERWKWESRSSRREPGTFGGEGGEAHAWNLASTTSNPPAGLTETFGSRRQRRPRLRPVPLHAAAW